MLFPFSHPGPSPPRVVITGVGIVTALGHGWSANAHGFRSGRLAMRPVTLFDVARQRVKVAAEVDMPASMPSTRLQERDFKRMDRAAKMLLLATHEAWNQSGWEPADDLPIVLGTTSAGMSFGQDYYRQAIAVPHSHRNQATRVLNYQPQRQAMDLANAFGFSGPITVISNACASGANAIGHAWDLLRYGRAQRVLTGGYDALCHLVFSGFDSLQALSPTQCRPFDANRDGLALGEGAAVLMLETLDFARRRDATILGEVAGYGASTDSHHLTQPHPDGNAAFLSMEAACRSGGVNVEQVDYINAHGTGTPLNDIAEAAAINRWAGPHASRVRVSSTKAGIGHLLGGAGAVETAVCVMALAEQWLPPMLTVETPEPACLFPVIRRPTEAKLTYALTNSFGFGGANATVMLKRWN